MSKFIKAGKKAASMLLVLALIFTLFAVSVTSASAAYDMKTSSRGVDLIKSFEGFLKFQIWDHAQWTIGYGTRCDYNEFPNGISYEQAEERLRREIGNTEYQVNKFARQNGLKLNQNQFDAMVSFAYNVGEYIWFTSDFFTLRNYILDGIGNHSAADFEYAFGLYCKAGGQVLDGLVRRRAAEAALFNTPIPTYTLAYNANGGSGAPAAQTIEDGNTVNISTVRPSRDGYEFAGWATSAGAASAGYKGGESYTPKANLTLYAVWLKDNTVTYNANGGSGAPAAQTKKQSASLTLSSEKPVRTGYTFIGWSTEKLNSSAEYQAGGKYTGSTDIKLYAIWREMSIVCFDPLDGGFEAKTDYSYGDITHDGTVDKQDAELLDAYISGNYPLSDEDKVICDVDMNGKVDENDLYLISKAASGDIPSLPAKMYDYNGRYGVLPTATAENLYFMGWSKTKDGKEMVSSSNVVKTGVSVLYPVWSDSPKKGDIDFNGSVNVSDILLLKNYIMESAVLSDTVMSVCDMDGNGELNVSDIMQLIAMINS